MPPSEEAFYRLVGERIAGARRRRRLSQEKLAPAVGLRRPSVANIEKGRQAVALHVLVKFSQVLGVPATELIPSDSELSSSPQVDQKLSELSSSERAWAETVLGPRLMED